MTKAGKATNLIVFNYDPVAKTYTPVTPEEYCADTEGYSVPDVPMTRPQRRRFQALNRKYRESMTPELAFHYAKVDAMLI
ncbi:hypothetical protein ACM25N_15675 [Roseovarius sp. C7]|uniref:hypothetical protein n=1 Tax=Roseovarius sp. C7 TaxID=3398643 RepID=UPI0039F73D8F